MPDCVSRRMMKLTKIAAILAIAALAVMAAVTASASASAKLCSTSGTGNACESGHGKVYTGKIVETLKANTQATLAATGAGATSILKCSASTTEGEIKSGETGTGVITSQTFSTCTSETVCSGATTVATSASTGAPWNMTATTTTAGISNTNGRMDVTGTDITFTLACIGIPICTYKATNPRFDVTGSDVINGAALTSESVVLTRTSGSESTCGTDANWSATYVATTPSTLMIE